MKQQGVWRILVVVFIGVGILMAGVLFFLSVFFHRTWQANTDKNIILIPESINGYTGKILFAHISPTTHKIQLIKLNPELKVNVIGGYQEYPLRSIYPLWRLEKKDEKTLSSAFSFALGIGVDQVWASDAAHFDAEKTDFQAVAQNILFFKISTNLSLADRIWLYQFAHDLRPDEAVQSKVETLSDWQKVAGSLRFSLDPNCSLAVVNTLSVSGVGTQVGKVFEASGFSVLRITDEERAQPKTELILANSQTKCALEQDHLKQVMPVAFTTTTDLSRANQYRAQMVLVLGEDVRPFFLGSKK